MLTGMTFARSYWMQRDTCSFQEQDEAAISSHAFSKSLVWRTCCITAMKVKTQFMVVNELVARVKVATVKNSLGENYFCTLVALLHQ